MDFGIAKTVASGGTVAGNPGYWAPEQAAGPRRPPRGRRIFNPRSPQIGMSFAEAARRYFGQHGPLAFHGQVEGSIVMGAGEVLTEDVIFDKKGNILNPNLHDYLIPTIADAPEIDSCAVPSYEPRGPYGAKEVGEGSMVPVLGSIANAIYDAVGVRITSLPITAEKVLKALQEKNGSQR
jgi:hypothetical protein